MTTLRWTSFAVMVIILITLSTGYRHMILPVSFAVLFLLFCWTFRTRATSSVPRKDRS